MALPNLSGSNIQDTYQRVLHTANGIIYDGTGSLIPIMHKLDGTDYQITASGYLSSSHFQTGTASMHRLKLNNGQMSSPHNMIISIEDTSTLMETYFKVRNRTANQDLLRIADTGVTYWMGPGQDAAMAWHRSPTFTCNLDNVAEEQSFKFRAHAYELAKFRSGNADSGLQRGIELNADVTASGAITASGDIHTNEIHEVQKIRIPTSEIINIDNGAQFTDKQHDSSMFQVYGGSTIGGAASHKHQLTGQVMVSGSISCSGDIEAQQFHIRQITSSVLYKSGSTKFGDSTDDLHEMTGSLRITGSIYMESNNADRIVLSRSYSGGVDISTAAGITLHAPSTDQVDIRSIGRQIAVFKSEQATLYGDLHLGSGGQGSYPGRLMAPGKVSSSAEVYGTQFWAASKRAIGTVGDNILFGADTYGTKIDGSSLQISAGNVGITGSITAVQDLTGSGVLTYGTQGDNQLHTLYGKLKVVSSDITIGDGHVSASGDIRATGSVYALTGSFGTGTTTITDNISTTGNISSSGDIQSSTITTRDLEATGKVRIKGSDITLEGGHISASGDILTTGSFVAGGNVSAGEGGTGSFDHIITSTGSIEFRDGSTKLGSIKFDSSAGFQSLDSNDNSGKITSKNFHCESHLENDGTITQHAAATFNAPITASIISASSTITADDINTRNLEATGKVRIKGSEITLEGGHISSSGDIRATGSIYALTGSFGTGTTTITDVIHTTGTISGSSMRVTGTVTAEDVNTRNLEATGKVRIKGSDITLESGSVSASGDIRATGSMYALTGSFGTGTTTITDVIHTTGTISGSSLQTSGGIVGNSVVAPTVRSENIVSVEGKNEITLGKVSERITAVINGDIRIKGSDMFIGSGSISASGTIHSTGSITSGGDISAGTGCTGSFDHIITTNNTIEFRDANNRSSVLGYLRYDAADGIQALNDSEQQLTRKADQLKTARTIGGVSFNGTSNINLPGVNTTGNQDTTGNAATSTTLETARTIGGVSFDGSANINLPGVNTTGNQNTTGKAATAGTADYATKIGSKVSNLTFTVLENGVLQITDGRNRWSIRADG